MSSPFLVWATALMAVGVIETDPKGVVISRGEERPQGEKK